MSLFPLHASLQYLRNMVLRVDSHCGLTITMSVLGTYTCKLYVTLKDARSVSLYRYNRSSILQYAKYTKSIIFAKGIAKFCDILKVIENMYVLFSCLIRMLIRY